MMDILSDPDISVGIASKRVPTISGRNQLYCHPHPPLVAGSKAPKRRQQESNKLLTIPSEAQACVELKRTGSTKKGAE